jgi:glucose-1-phosphate cytidylyltransferase
MAVLEKNAEPWSVTLIDTGDATMTGGRLRRVAPYLQEEDPFCFTYGDGLANVDISALIAFHRRYGKLATITAVHPSGRHGAMNVVESKVLNFMEKPRGDGARARPLEPVSNQQYLRGYGVFTP